MYGSSAVGKDTFIRKIVENPPAEFLKRMGWDKKKLVMISESIEYLAHIFPDNVNEKRKEIISKAFEAKDKDSVLLIKGQDIDIVEGLPELLKKKAPDFKHKILFLHTDLKIVYERCKKKPWWNDQKVSLDKFKSWLRYQIGLLSKLKDFEIIAISNEGEEYKKISFPPEL